MSIYYNYAPDGKIIFVLSYFDVSEAIGKCFVETTGKRFHVNLLRYAHYFT